MAYTISISPQLYNLLREQAEQAQTSLDLLAESALRDYLYQDKVQWRRTFEMLLAKVHLRAARFTSEEIEADITAAASEVQETRRASYSPA